MTEATGEAMFLAYRSWKTKRNLLRRPRRIILVRHGESQANLDPTLYARVPDNKIELSPHGVEQALEAGRTLRQIVGDESVTFYVSPFARSRQTLDGILKGSAISCPTVREDPRLREQEWGNFQDPDVMCTAMKRRREVGAFFYRFPEGESGADVFDRVSLFLETLFREFKKRDASTNIVLVSHGITLRLFLMRYYHWTTEVFHDLWNPKNATPIVLQRPSMLAKAFCLATELESNKGLYKLYLPLPAVVCRCQSILPADASPSLRAPSSLFSHQFQQPSQLTQQPTLGSFDFPDATPTLAMEESPLALAMRCATLATPPLVPPPPMSPAPPLPPSAFLQATATSSMPAEKRQKKQEEDKDDTTPK